MKRVFIGFLIVCFTSCFTIKPIEFRKVENVASKKASEDPKMTFDLSMHNPNNWSLRLSEVDAEITIDGVTLGKANLANSVRLTRNSDFILPMETKSSITDFSKFTSIGLNILLGNQTATANI